MKKILRIHCLSKNRAYLGERLFLKILSEHYHVVGDDKSPHIVVYEHQHPVNMIPLLKLRWRYGYHALFVSLTGENRPPMYKYMDYMFSFYPTDDKNFQAAVSLGSIMLYPFNQYKQEAPHYESAPKNKFCNFIYRNDRYEYPQTKTRRDFCRLLSQYKKVDCPSKSLNNMPSIGEEKNNKIEFLSHYKFTIAFENTSSDWYLTEKIYHPFLVGSIPIYWGCPQVTKFYNPKSFINCHDYTCFEEVVEKVKEIDNNPDLYAQYRAADPIPADSPIHNYSREKILERSTMIAEKALENVAMKQKPSMKSYDKWRVLAQFTRDLPIIFKKYLVSQRTAHWTFIASPFN